VCGRAPSRAVAGPGHREQSRFAWAAEVAGLNRHHQLVSVYKTISNLATKQTCRIKIELGKSPKMVRPILLGSKNQDLSVSMF
jgi:hypothetical protein